MMHGSEQVEMADATTLMHTSIMSNGHLSEEVEDDDSSAESTFDENELLDSATQDEVAAQLAAAGR